MIIWTRAYRPFIMGGNVNAPICCEVEPDCAPFEIGKGYLAVTVTSPKGVKFVVETMTGGIVGTRIREVREDVAGAPEGFIENQLREASEKVKDADRVSPGDFWNYLRA